MIRKKARSQRKYRSELVYARIGSLILIMLTYGFGIPLFLIFGIICLSVHIVVDKYLITYWYQPDQLGTSEINSEFFFVLSCANIFGFLIMTYTIL